MTEAEERAKHYLFSPTRLKQLGALNQLAKRNPELFCVTKYPPIPDKYYVGKKKK